MNNQFWKPPKEIRAAISRGNRKVKEYEDKQRQYFEDVRLARLAEQGSTEQR